MPPMEKADTWLKIRCVASSLLIAGIGHVQYGPIGRGGLFMSAWLTLLLLLAFVSFRVTVVALIALGLIAAVDLLRQPLVDPPRSSADFWIRRVPAIPFAIALAVILRIWYVEAFAVPQGAMIPTLQPNDHMLVDKTGWKPHRGDVIIFRFPKDETKDFVMRAVGLSGDHVSIHNDQLVVNGHAEPAGTKKNFPAEGEYTVPADHVFVLGDNRDHSYDSREWGPVPIKNVKGRAIVVWKRAGAFTWTRIR
jgi:signal peptidase I